MTRRSLAAAAFFTIVLASFTIGCAGESPVRPAVTSSPTSLLANTEGSASALAVNTDTLQVRTAVTFTKSGCPDLPGLTINGSGEQFVVTNSRVGDDGITHVQATVLVTGTATDSSGANYRFNYHNHASQEIAPGGFPFSAQISDHFNLVGNGKADHLAVSFVARITFTSPTDPPQAEFVHLHGNPFLCDPI